MAINKETVEYVAHLARIELKTNELEKLSHQLQDILDFIDNLKKVNIERVLPTSHIKTSGNVLREDAPGQSLSSAKALENAHFREGNFFFVPKIID